MTARVYGNNRRRESRLFESTTPRHGTRSDSEGQTHSKSKEFAELPDIGKENRALGRSSENAQQIAN
jgi:hypothetical protein